MDDGCESWWRSLAKGLSMASEGITESLNALPPNVLCAISSAPGFKSRRPEEQDNELINKSDEVS